MLHSAAILIVTKFGPSIFPLSFWFIEQRIAAVARKSMQDIMLHSMSISLGIIWTEMRFTEFRHFLHRVQSSSLHDRYWKMSRPLHVKELCLAFQEFNPLWYIQLCFNIYGFNLLCDALWCFFYHRTHSHTHTRIEMTWMEAGRHSAKLTSMISFGVFFCFFFNALHDDASQSSSIYRGVKRERGKPHRGVALYWFIVWLDDIHHITDANDAIPVLLSSHPLRRINSNMMIITIHL